MNSPHDSETKGGVHKRPASRLLAIAATTALLMVAIAATLLRGHVGASIPVLLAAALWFYLAIRNGWYLEFVLAFGFLAPLGLFIYGLHLLNDTQQTNNTAGAVLLVGAVGLLLGCALVTWFLYFKRPRTM